LGDGVKSWREYINMKKLWEILLWLTFIIDGIYTCYTGISSHILEIFGMYFKLETPKQYIQGGILIIFGIFMLYITLKNKSHNK